LELEPQPTVFGPPSLETLHESGKRVNYTLFWSYLVENEDLVMKGVGPDTRSENELAGWVLRALM
jgi:hypothetical protein